MLSSEESGGELVAVGVQEVKEKEMTHWRPRSGEPEDWRIKNETVLSKRSFLLNSREMSDVKFIFPGKNGEPEEKTVYGHKFILAVGSRVFHKMFYKKEHAQFVTIVNDEVRMDDPKITFNAEDFTTFIKFLYTDKINHESTEGLSFDLILGILDCAEYYEVLSLKKYCVIQLEKYINTVHVIPVFEVAFLYGEQELHNKAMNFIDENLQAVIESEEIQSCKEESLFEIMKRDSLDIDECHLLDLALKWAENECKRQDLEPTIEIKRKVLGDAFFQIRFPLLTPAKILELLSSNLLTIKETVDLLVSKLEITPKILKGPWSDCATKSVPKLAPGISFKSNLRVFGLKKEKVLESQLDLKWKEANNFDHLKSLAKMDANLYMTGFRRIDSDSLIKSRLKSRGFGKHLKVKKLCDGTYHVRFTYCPFTVNYAEFLNPTFFGFKKTEGIEIEDWRDEVDEDSEVEVSNSSLEDSD